MNQPVLHRKRIESIDLLRGLVMVIMAIDHVRDFFHNVPEQPLDLQTTTPAFFFTRWITHFCAPIFLFLAGVSAYLAGIKMGKSALSLFLIKRGFWLVFIEVAIVTMGITFDPLHHVLILQVIWAIGVSMILLGIVVRLPYPVILALALCIVLGHNLLDYPEAANQGKVGFWWDLLHVGHFSLYKYAENHFVLIVYAFVPWAGIMLSGYCLGKVFEPGYEEAKRRKMLLGLGWGMILLFIIIRAANGYGDPVPWSVQRNGLYTFLSFINANKYPPSLAYILMTIGPGLLFLALTENVKNRFSSILNVFGRVPFFYYVVHFYLIHFLLVILFFISGYGTKDIISPNSPFLFLPPGLYISLAGTYAVWLLVLFIMYPLCKKYDRYKNTHRHWWLKYL